jgi:DNA-binding phage protein
MAKKKYYVNANPQKQSKYRQLISAIQKDLQAKWIAYELKINDVARQSGLCTSTVRNTLKLKSTTPRFLTTLALGDALGFDITVHQRDDNVVNLTAWKKRKVPLTKSYVRKKLRVAAR